MQVEMQQDLGVAVRTEADAATFELGPQLAVIQDLAVLRHAHGAVRAKHRLVAVLDIDDREPARRDAGGAVDMRTAAVRASVDEARVHRIQDGEIWSALAHIVVAAGDPAHRVWGLTAACATSLARSPGARRSARSW